MRGQGPGYDWSNEMAEFERIQKAVLRDRKGKDRNSRPQVGGEPNTKRSRTSADTSTGGGAAAAGSGSSGSRGGAAGTPAAVLSARTPLHLGLTKHTLLTTKAMHTTLSNAVEIHIEQAVVDDDTLEIDAKPFLENLRTWLSPSVFLPSAYLRDVLVSVLARSQDEASVTHSDNSPQPLRFFWLIREHGWGAPTPLKKGGRRTPSASSRGLYSAT